VKGIQRLASTVFCGVGLLWSGGGIAADQIQNKSQTNEKGFFDLLSERATLNYLGIFRGAALNDLGNSYQPTVNGASDESAPLSVENLVNLGIKITPQLSVGASAHFYYYPVGSPVGTGQSLQMFDPILYFSVGDLVDYQGLNLGTRVTVQLPVTQADNLLKNNLASAITSLWVLNYNAPKSNLTVGLVGSVTGYVANAAAAPDVRTYKLVLAPNATYQLTSRVAATLWVDLLTGVRKGGTGFFSGMNTLNADIEPGISWEVVRDVTINPFLNIYPSNPTLASTSIQANISAKAF
jgi:hypothetical protein